MEPLELIGQTLTPNGIDMKLTRRANEYIILANGKTLMSSPGRFDAVLLDVDNGPAASDNARLYDDRGLAAAHAALKIGEVLAIWSARDDRKFEQRLRYGGFTVEVERVRARLKKGGPRHTIFLGHKPLT